MEAENLNCQTAGRQNPGALEGFVRESEYQAQSLSVAMQGNAHNQAVCLDSLCSELNPLSNVGEGWEETVRWRKRKGKNV